MSDYREYQKLVFSRLKVAETPREQKGKVMPMSVEEVILNIDLSQAEL